jgi:hypothetical protein
MTDFYFEEKDGLVNVKIKSDSAVNVWSGRVLLTPPVPDVKIVTGGSVTAFWQTSPAYMNGEISFTGGKPNGFDGDGIIFSFVPGNGSFRAGFSPETDARLNDGAGTPANATLRGIEIGRREIADTAIAADRTPPEHFSPVIYEDKNFFDGRPVVIFSAEDRGSGINYYEVREVTGNGETAWHRATSPYVLNADVARIEIKAVDNAGNERIETTGSPSAFYGLFSAVAEILFILILIFLLLYNIRRWRKKRSS